MATVANTAADEAEEETGVESEQTFGRQCMMFDVPLHVTASLRRTLVQPRVPTSYIGATMSAPWSSLAPALGAL